MYLHSLHLLIQQAFKIDAVMGPGNKQSSRGLWNWGTRSEIDPLVTDESPKYNVWVGLPSPRLPRRQQSTRCAYMGGNDSGSGETSRKVRRQQPARRVERIEMCPGSWKLRARCYFCSGWWRNGGQPHRALWDIIQNKAFTHIEMDYWALSYRLIQRTYV